MTRVRWSLKSGRISLATWKKGWYKVTHISFIAGPINQEKWKRSWQIMLGHRESCAVYHAGRAILTLNCHNQGKEDMNLLYGFKVWVCFIFLHFNYIAFCVQLAKNISRVTLDFRWRDRGKECFTISDLYQQCCVCFCPWKNCSAEKMSIWHIYFMDSTVISMSWGLQWQWVINIREFVAIIARS